MKIKTPFQPPRIELGEGFHQIDKRLYLEDPCVEPSLTSSLAKLILAETGGSPLHAWAAHPRLGAIAKDPTAAMVRGDLMDSIIVGGDTEIAILPDMMPDAKGVMRETRGEFRMDSAKQWKEEQKALGFNVCNQETYDDANKAAKIIVQKIADMGIDLNGSTHQQTIIWKDGPVWCRSRLDNLKRSETDAWRIREFKSIASATEEAIANTIWNLGYDIQAYSQIEAVKVAAQEFPLDVSFEWIFFECEPPWDVVVVPISEAWLSLGKWRWDTAVARWISCLESDVWPGKGGEDGRAHIQPKEWMLTLMETLVASEDW